jgi:hypothetical protein
MRHLLPILHRLSAAGLAGLLSGWALAEALLLLPG